MKKLLYLLLSLPAFAGEMNTLTKDEIAQGWQLLFDGKDLSHFRKAKSEEKPGANWQVHEGLLQKMAGARAGDIVTKEKYLDFTFSWEWRISPKGNNGIKYLVDENRKAPGPEYQMLDDAKHPDGKIGPQRQTAALYDIMPPASDKPLKTPGEWNHSLIVVKAMKVEHWLNGVLVLQYELESPELKTAIAKSKFKEIEGFDRKIAGHIMLTDHVDGCDFRNLKILASTEKK
jgi:Domain of Unknown Function (DUF1080)